MWAMKDSRPRPFFDNFLSFSSKPTPVAQSDEQLSPTQTSFYYMSTPLPYSNQGPFDGSDALQNFGDQQLYAEEDWAQNAPQQQDFSFFPGGWPSYAGSSYAAALMPSATQSNVGHQQTTHQPAHFHQRAASNSSVTSFPDSPYSQASSLHYPQVGGGRPSAQYLIPSLEGGYGGFVSSAAASPQQQTHLPTPTHTPLRSTFNMNSRRTASPHKAASARAAAQSMFQGTGNSSQNLSNPPPQLLSRQSTTGQEWLSTPRSSYTGEDGETAQLLNATRHVPKFDRTFSDMCGDEFYNPQQLSAPATGRTVSQKPQYLSPRSDTLSVRLNDANQARSSPTRDGIPQGRIQSAARLRQQDKMETDARAWRQHTSLPSQEQPDTISPQDAFPEQAMQEEEHMPSLFPSSSGQSNGESNLYTTTDWSNSQHVAGSTPPFQGSITTTSGPQFGPHTGTSGLKDNAMNNYSSRLYSMEPNRSDDGGSSSQEDESSPDPSIERPNDTLAGRGTYSCTYHGCTQRFASATLLQKHKRDDHRSTGAGNVVAHSQSPDPQGMTQAGPHKCTRINPATGKPCNTIFSRPYDLTRHEDTIHAERKKVRCPHCTEEKSFSRADALTRHLRVVHPSIRFPGKHSRRRLD